MLASDPIYALLAGGLCVAGLYSALSIHLHQRRLHAETSRPYTPWQKLRDVLTPLGMGVLGIRGLLIACALTNPDGLFSRALLILATLGIVGGIAGMRIRRLPD